MTQTAVYAARMFSCFGALFWRAIAFTSIGLRGKRLDEARHSGAAAVPTMRNNVILDDKNTQNRPCLRDSEDRELILANMLAAIELKKRQRLRSRSLALFQLIERGIEATQ